MIQPTCCLQDGLRQKVGAGAPATKIRSAPFVQIPLGVTEDRLVGTVDIEASMKVSPRASHMAVYSSTCERGYEGGFIHCQGPWQIT